MRLMLGNPKPNLLVNVDDNFDPNSFKFWVVNGAWDGKFGYGTITVDRYPETVMHNFSIICFDQNRLRGKYDVVFDNFDNPEYVAPVAKVINFADFDDIPF